MRGRSSRASDAEELGQSAGSVDVEKNRGRNGSAPETMSKRIASSSRAFFMTFLLIYKYVRVYVYVCVCVCMGVDTCVHDARKTRCVRAYERVSFVQQLFRAKYRSAPNDSLGTFDSAHRLTNHPFDDEPKFDHGLFL